MLLCSGAVVRVPESGRLVEIESAVRVFLLVFIDEDSAVVGKGGKSCPVLLGCQLAAYLHRATVPGERPL